MAKITVESRLREVNPDLEVMYFKHYAPDGTLVEQRTASREVDYAKGNWTRTSADNGRTWTEWKTDFSDDDGGRHGRLENSPEGDELLGGDFEPSLADPVSGCRVGVGSSFYYLKGHDIGYFAMWEKGEDNFRTHAYFAFRRPDGTLVRRMLEFEDGGRDFDPEAPRDPAFIDKNRAMAGDLQILPDGDLAFIVYPTMTLCCRLAGVDVEQFFPSCPNLQVGLLFARAHWNAGRQDYDITYSNPVMLSDLQSSRGIMEPGVTILNDGRIMIVFRGSNLISEAWNTRISDSAPNFKWHVLSSDGGKTFCPPMPWHFDSKEVVYSPASISRFYRSSKNGNLYWIGNIIDEPWRIEGNDPRWPLQICQVDLDRGCLLKDTLTVIDTVRDGQTAVELSNFGTLENRETLDLEMNITKMNFNGKTEEEGFWYTEAWEYTIRFED